MDRTLMQTVAGPTPQSEPLIGRTDEMQQRPHGGWTFETTPWERLTRFLVLGVEGGTYYQKPREIAVESIECVKTCMAEDWRRTLQEAMECSTRARAPRNDAALYVLAEGISNGPDEAKAMVVNILPIVARTGTHLFVFMAYCRALRGTGHALRRAIQRWYQRDVSEVAFQVLKYRKRENWTHKDMLRLFHPKPPTLAHDSLYHWITRGTLLNHQNEGMEHLDIVRDFCALQAAEDETTVRALLDQNHRLSWEMIPTEKQTPKVWKDLVPRLGLEALRRKLGVLTANGVLAPLSDLTDVVATRFNTYRPGPKPGNRLNPFRLLQTISQYAKGEGERGKLTWKPISEIRVALGEALDRAFGDVPRFEQRVYLAIDVSGSMSGGSMWQLPCQGMAPCTPIEVATGIAVALARHAPRSCIYGFDTDVRPLSMHNKTPYDQALQELDRWNGGGTNGSIPFIHARRERIFADAFILVTDHESWAGDEHVSEAFRDYRKQVNGRAKCVTITVQNSSARLADPRDPFMLDTVGFDADTFAGVHQFIEA